LSASAKTGRHTKIIALLAVKPQPLLLRLSIQSGKNILSIRTIGKKVESRELWSIETMIKTVLEVLIVTVTLTVGEVCQWLGDQNYCCRDTPRLVVV
jgi:hypothetical protein